ncbi:MAG: DNA polymerase III subunit delta [Clostridia bacterium]|nr:DNA polymerase III subunit delta [Clostridia bacterium]
MSSKIYPSRSGSKDKGADTLIDLKNQIKSKTPLRVYLFYGEEPFLIDFYLNEMKKLILADDQSGMNLTVFDGRLDINALLDACDTFPVFAEKKLVIVKNSELFTAKSKKESATESAEGEEAQENGEGEKAPEGNKAQEALKNYLPDLPDTTCLIFVETQVDKRLGVYKQLTKQGLGVEFSRQSPGELVPWVAKGFQRSGKTITPEAAQYLVAICDPDMYTLKNEILKLDAYTGERREITLNDVRLMATPTIKSVIFDLMDAVVQRNSAKALRLLDDMLSIKEPEQKILAMLSKQAAEMLKLKVLTKKGVSQAQTSQYFQGKHPYALKMLQMSAERIDENFLRNLLKGCMDADSRYKKGLISPRLALEVLLGNIKT